MYRIGIRTYEKAIYCVVQMKSMLFCSVGHVWSYTLGHRGRVGWVEHHIRALVYEKEYLAATRSLSACLSLS